jgi:hypothetical protein
MANPAQSPLTLSELVTDLQNRTREKTGITITDNIAKRWLNIALLDMHVGGAEKYPWAERQADLQTQPQYTTGTVTITQGSTSLVGVGTAWDTVNAFSIKNMRQGGKVVVAGSQDVYTVDAVGGDLAATLLQSFVGASVAGGAYRYFEDEYDLASDFARPVDQRQFSDGVLIGLIGRTEFRRRYPRNHTTGRPTIGTIIEKDFSGSADPVRRIRLHRPPDVAYRIPYSYITRNLVVSDTGTMQESMVADDDQPIVPVRYRHAITLHALYNWLRDRKDDERSREVKAEYVELVTRVRNDSEIGQQNPQIRPRVSAYRQRARRPYGGLGRFDVGGRFDRLEDIR